MKKIVIALAFVPVALSLSACKKGHSKNPARAASEALKDKDLQGTWKSECSSDSKEMDGLPGGDIVEAVSVVGAVLQQLTPQPPPQQGEQPKPEQTKPEPAKAEVIPVKSYRTIYNFAGNSVTRSLVFYSLEKCGREALTFSERGEFKLETDPNKKSNDGGRNLDLDFRTLVVSVKDGSAVETMNKIKFCGNTDWKADGKERDVTKAAKDLTCYKAEVPRKIPTIYRIDSGTMYFGKIAKAGERAASVNFGSRFTK